MLFQKMRNCGEENDHGILAWEVSKIRLPHPGSSLCHLLTSAHLRQPTAHHCQHSVQEYVTLYEAGNPFLNSPNYKKLLYWDGFSLISYISLILCPFSLLSELLWLHLLSLSLWYIPSLTCLQTHCFLSPLSLFHTTLASVNPITLQNSINQSGNSLLL